MARMIPDIDPGKIRNRAEATVYKALKEQLPADWVVRHHYPACLLCGACWNECEADFIVMAPGRGLMFLEVKGSEGFACEKGIWYRIKPDHSREAADNPFEQASATKHKVTDRIAKKLGYGGKNNFPGIYGHAVVYPNGRIVGPLCASQDPQIMIAHADMGGLAARLENAFLQWDLAGRGASFTTEVMSFVVRLLGDDCRFVPVVAADVDADEQQIEELTLQQWKTMEALLGNPRVLVRGVAGSGKTMLATWAAARMAEAGKRVIFLCYNEELAGWLTAKYGKESGVEFIHFHSLCSRLAKGAGLRFLPYAHGDEKHFWRDVAAGMMMNALDGMEATKKYDYVFVDEAQDFHASWWVPVQCLLKDPDHGGLYLFVDPMQMLYSNQEAQFPNIETTVELEENCRNTKKIVGYCRNIVAPNRMCGFDLSPLGIDPQIVDSAIAPSDRATQAKRICANLLKEEFQPSQIAVLSPWSHDNQGSSLGLLDEVSSVPFKGTSSGLEDWLAGKCIHATTVKSFKGLEADCIILADVPVPGAIGFSVADLYVAASRAKHRLVIIPSSDDAMHALRQHIQKSV